MRRTVRPWPNDQTLFVKHLISTCQTRFGHLAKLVRKHILLASSKNALNFFKNIAQQILLFKQCFVTWQNARANFKCLTMFDRLPRTYNYLMFQQSMVRKTVALMKKKMLLSSLKVTKYSINTYIEIFVENVQVVRQLKFDEPM